MNSDETISELLSFSRFLGEEHRHLAVLGEGNTSAKIDDETFMVKASGSCLQTLGEDDVVACRFDKLLPMLDLDDLSDQDIEDHLLACRVDPESKKPSVETLFHAYLLSLPEINFIGHTHSIPVNQILCSPLAEQFATKKLFPDEIVCCGAQSVFVPYTDPGLKLSQTIRDETQAFMDRFGGPPRVILLANHGLITLGKTSGAVKAAMLMAHKSAEIFVGAAALGGPVFMSDADVDRIANRTDEHYRQPMLTPPYQYRDARTDRTYPVALEKAGQEEIFAETGIQFMSINTLYQLIAEVEDNRELVDIAGSFLTIADYFNYLFSGVARAEVSLASTTQLYNPTTGKWSTALMEQFGIPERLFPPVVPSGTRLGPLTQELCDETGLTDVDVIASCSHDTGAAVAAVPAKGDDWAYLSSGTWSLIGVELPSPLINNDVQEYNFTNEAGVGGTTRFLKNIIGLWLLQESRREWARQGQALDYAEINQLAGQAEPFRSLINPNAERFLKPDDMPAKIAAYCRETEQPEPSTPGQFARCILESLALLYRQALDDIEKLTGRRIARLHIVGGGSQSALLNQFAASATGRTVLAGPVEATAVGNVLIQAIATGDLNSLEALRRVVRDSFTIETFEPERSPEWQQSNQRFATLDLTT